MAERTSGADADSVAGAPPGSETETAGRDPHSRAVQRVAARVVVAAATVAYLALVAWITLGPAPYDPAAASLLDRALALLQSVPATAWVTFDLVEFTANIALFVPLGVLFLLLFGGRRWWAALALAVALTCAIELAQGAWLPTRVSDPRDVVANSTGAALGTALVLAGRALAGAFRGGAP